MRARTILVALAIVGAFVYFTSDARLNRGKLFETIRASGPIWAGPGVTHSAGLSSDEQNSIDIYKRAHNATVNISSTVYRRGAFMELYPGRNAGSGFLIDERGFILTNYHVVSGGQGLTVTLADKSKYKAQILDRDPANDLALIKIEPRTKLSTLRIGDSDGIQVGQKVLAIGNPFGLEGTLTTGVVSSLGRTIQDETGRELEGLVQTDAAINPGNSGGPLLDSQGSVIGVNTAIYGPGSNIGIGFAMPVNRSKTMLDDYQQGRKYAPPRLGVGVIYVAGDVAELLRLPRDGGLLVQQIAPGSAAEVAGIRGPRSYEVIGNAEVGVGGDLIVEIDGKKADRPDAIARAISKRRAGDKIDIVIFRQGKAAKMTVTLGAAREERL